MDYQTIDNLFQAQQTLPKFKYKRWTKIQDENRGNYGAAIRYNCNSISDELVNYSEGYILVNANITAANLANNSAIAIKDGSNSLINTATVRFNNHEVDKNHYAYLTTTFLNLLEYSSDYAESVALQYAFAKDTADNHTSAGVGVRKAVIASGQFANNTLPVLIKIPLSYLSPFFRRLDFPIINNKLDLELELRGNACLIKDAAVNASQLVVTNTELYLPIVQLPSDAEKKFLHLLPSSYTKKLTWDHMEVFVHNMQNTATFNQQITASLDGVRKMYVMSILNAGWNNQDFSEIPSSGSMNNINITIDSADYFGQDVRNDHEAYTLLQECFNMGGHDYNTGSLISFQDFKQRYRLYAFDLSHQKIFESDPRKSQTIRFRCEFPNAVARVLVVVLAREKTTEICMNDASKTKTI